MANTGMHQQQSQTNVPRLISGSRNILEAKWVQDVGPSYCPYMEFVTEADAELIVADNKASANQTFLTILSLLNTTSNDQATALQTYYASAIVTLFPHLEDVFTEALAMNGIGVTKIKLPSEAAENNITMSTGGSGAKTLAMLGQLLIIPFKNLTDVNYQQFMDRRIMAMKSFLGISVSETQLRAIADVEKVIAIRSVFGQNVKVRQSLMQLIIRGERERYPYGNLYTFLSEILAWTDMAAFTFIADALLEHRSPILRDPRVQTEVRNFAEALYVITRYAHPQFYRVLGPARGAVLLERSRFPILLAVAQKVRAETYSTVNQFAQTISHDNVLVVELFTIHMRYLDQRRAPEHNMALRFLHTFSNEGGDVRAFETNNPRDLRVPGPEEGNQNQAN